VAGVSTWQIVTSREDLDDLRTGWQALHSLNPLHSPFQSWSWVTAWLKHLAGTHELQIICGRNDRNELVFVLPLVIASRDNGPRSVCTTVCGYGSDCSDYIGCLRTPELEDELAVVTADAIDRYIDRGVRLVMPSLDGSRGFPNELRGTITNLGRASRLKRHHSCPAIALPGSLDEYLAGLSSNFRAQVRRHHRKVVKHPEVEFRPVDADDASSFAREVVRLNRARMRDKGIESSFESEAFRNFFLDAVPGLANEGSAWMDTIVHGDKVLAAALTLLHADRMYFYSAGFDDSASALRPGTALHLEVLTRGIERGYVSYDFLRGSEPYKYRWGATETWTWKLTAYPAGAGGQVQCVRERLTAGARAKARSLKRQFNR
jgi:CelD/BcsL family acetyltransferase involved in cellulose biosynthesis